MILVNAYKPKPEWVQYKERLVKLALVSHSC